MLYHSSALEFIIERYISIVYYYYYYYYYYKSQTRKYNLSTLFTPQYRAQTTLILTLTTTCTFTKCLLRSLVIQLHYVSKVVFTQHVLVPLGLFTL